MILSNLSILPYNTRLRLLISAVDVLHSWAIPSFGTKVDACPGRLNETSLYLKRSGIFFGQCSEICWWLNMFNSAEKILNMFIFSINYFIVINNVLSWELKLKKVGNSKILYFIKLIIKRSIYFFVERMLKSFYLSVAVLTLDWN